MLTTQLSLFAPSYPFQKVPNKAERKIIDEVFNGADYIANFLDDIIQMYPVRSAVWNNWTEQIFWVIGASCREDGYFYLYEIETGSIHLVHNCHTKPYLKNQ